jgi:hypothetical protein
MVKEQAFQFPESFLQAGLPRMQTDPSPVYSAVLCISQERKKGEAIVVIYSSANQINYWELIQEHNTNYELSQNITEREISETCSEEELCFSSRGPLSVEYMAG